MHRFHQLRRFAALLLLLGLASEARSQGAYISTAGPVNRALGGAAVAAPIDALGATYWNPATISGFAKSETALSLDVLFPSHTVSSSVGGLSGSTRADAGSFPLPNIGVVQQTQVDGLTLGFGMHSVAGFGTNLPADPTNPVLAPAPQGLGQVNSHANFLQLAPVISWALRDDLAIAAGPTITTGRVSVDPFVFGAANGDGSYASAHGTRYHWGGGFQLGAYYIHSPNWRFGASLKSRSWMQKFRAHGSDENGLPRELGLDLDLPMIISLGTSYDAPDDWLLALDLRYVDYRNTAGFGDRAVYDANGALGGLDFSSVMALALGAQRRLNERWIVRCGYTFNQSPIRNSESFFNLASPLMFQHMLSGGATLDLNEDLACHLAYSYVFDNPRSGPIIMPGAGAIAGSGVDNSLDAHVLSVGLTMRR